MYTTISIKYNQRLLFTITFIKKKYNKLFNLIKHTRVCSIRPYSNIQMRFDSENCRKYADT